MTTERVDARPRLAVDLVASTVTWVVFLTALSLLYRVGMAVMASGGFCARGGPYEIATECSNATAVLGTIAIPAMVVAILANAVLVKAWGPSLLMLCWPAMFTTMGVAFLRGAQLDGYSAITGYVVGGLFLVMGGTPFLLFKMVRHGAGWVGWEALALRSQDTSMRPGVHVTLDRAGRPVVTRTGSRVAASGTNVLAGVVFLAVCAVLSTTLAGLLHAGF